MKYLFVPVLLLSSYASALDFEGTTYVPVEIKAEASTGLDAIYVVADTHGVTMVYTAASASSTVKWSRYSRMGAAYSEELSPKREGNKLSIACDADDMGYVIEENGRSRYYWIINYAGPSTQLAFGEHTTRAGLRPHAFGIQRLGIRTRCVFTLGPPYIGKPRT